jgi:sec-independent protein translocase protein TatA
VKLLALIGPIGWPELVIILVVLLLLFGAKRLPEIARSLGRSTKEFKGGLHEQSSDEGTSEKHEEPKPAD